MIHASAIFTCACLLGVAGLAGCATLDGHAVAETHRLGDAPYYVEISQPRPTPGTCAAVLPVTAAPALAEDLLYAGRLGEFDALLTHLNGRVAGLQGCVRALGTVPAVTGSPVVYVGVADADGAPPEATDQRLATDRFAPMVLHLERPGAAWSAQLAAGLAQESAPYAIAVQLGVSRYAKGYSGAFRKEVVLGTGHRQPIRFLTAEDKPVEVLHLTGILLDGAGRPIRAGAEGIVLRDTPFLAQAVDVSRGFDPDELRRVLSSERRTDLAGSPLKLDVALQNLVAQLTRRPVCVPPGPCPGSAAAAAGSAAP